jgi:Ca-activated chloride channel homolog
LRATPQQQKALQYGFRPALPNITIGAPIDVAHGVDAHQPQATLNVPPADVVQAVQTSWENQRRKVDVMLILDRSGRMNDNGKIGAAKAGLTEFVHLLGNLDGLGLTTCSDKIDGQSPVQALGPNRQKILSLINGIDARGNTRLYDAIDEQVQALKSLSTKHIKVVVVLTVGMDDASSIIKNRLINDISTSGANAGEGIKVFTIAYGNDADLTGLTQIASATGGQEYSGSPQNIRQAYFNISQFF